MILAFQEKAILQWEGPVRVLENMRDDIEKYIRACAPCSMYKKSRDFL
jgi:hypothetical protein